MASSEFYGLHRVVKPQGRAPQGAYSVRNEPRLLSPYEALLDVELLNLDATSMKQIRTLHKDDVTAIKKAIHDTVNKRGKMHNEVTNSGGVLVGRVKEVGALSPYKSVPIGTRIIPLCSLTAIPLFIDSIGEVHEEQVTVQAKAIVFPCYKYTIVPNDFPLKVALSCIDVSRLVPQVEKLVRSKPGATILILGAGKAGLLAAVAARYFDPKCKIVIFDFKPTNLAVAKSLGVANKAARVDCRDVKAMIEAMGKYLMSEGADIVCNCVNIEGTEMPSSLAVKQGGTLVYFSMATSFGTGVLSTDDIEVLMGAGVFPDQADKTFALLNHNYNLKKYFYDINSENLPEPSPELWRPSQERVLHSNLVTFAHFLESNNVLRLNWYKELHSWSVTSNAEFWGYFWKFLGLKAFREPSRIVSPGARFQDTKFFSGALVNHAKSLLYQIAPEGLNAGTAPDDRIAMIWNGEDPKHPRIEFTYGGIRREVKQLALALKAIGVQKGDRVASLMPNNAHCVIAMLATTAIGAIWTSCSPDVGNKVAIERFGRVEPVVLFSTEHFSYNGKTHSTAKVVEFLAGSIPGLKIIALPHLFQGEIQFANINGTIQYAPFMAKFENLLNTPDNEWIEELPVDHPVYILYTSGTTGPPKCITQGYGVTLNHLKETILHCDIKPGETAFVYTNTGWMIWHWFISLLGIGCTLVLFDGSPFYPEPMALWRMIDREEVSYFGLSSRYLAALEKANVKPKEELGLSKLRLITSTGSPLSVASSYYVYREIKTDIHLASITGGTEINGCLALAVSVLPVYPAQIQGPALGMDVNVVDYNGRDVVDTPGELAVRSPFPSMPVKFWGDENGSRYNKAYFEEIPGLWVHGDHAQRTRDGGFFVFGRSDATLNPGGVRLGTADYYNVVETVQGVEDCLVVGRTVNDNEVVILFAKFSPGVDIAETKKKIVTKIRQELSPKHVPAEIVKVSEIPYNINFKKMEILVKKLIDGQDVSPFTSTLQNPQCLEEYHAWVKQANGQQAKL